MTSPAADGATACLLVYRDASVSGFSTAGRLPPAAMPSPLKVKDYRIEGAGRYTTMTLDTYEFIRRFLMHVLPKGLLRIRIRRYGLQASGVKAENFARMRALLDVAPPGPEPEAANGADAGNVLPTPCPCWGARILIIERFEGELPAASSPDAGHLQDRHVMRASCHSDRSADDLVS